MSIPKVDLTSISQWLGETRLCRHRLQNLGYNCYRRGDTNISVFSDFSAAILDLQLNGTVYKIADTIIKKFDPENMGVAAGISILSALELEIPLGSKLPPRPPIA